MNALSRSSIMGACAESGIATWEQAPDDPGAPQRFDASAAAQRLLDPYHHLLRNATTPNCTFPSDSAGPRPTRRSPALLPRNDDLFPSALFALGRNVHSHGVSWSNACITRAYTALALHKRVLFSLGPPVGPIRCRAARPSDYMKETLRVRTTAYCVGSCTAVRDRPAAKISHRPLHLQVALTSRTRKF